jgi:hypothetical protein
MNVRFPAALARPEIGARSLAGRCNPFLVPVAIGWGHALPAHLLRSGAWVTARLIPGRQFRGGLDGLFTPGKGCREVRFAPMGEAPGA